MTHEPTSTLRARHLRERRSKGVVAPLEIGEGGIELLVGNGLLKEHKTRKGTPCEHEKFSILGRLFHFIDGSVRYVLWPFRNTI
jgi:hypothetical protein